jgi:internalin A
MTISIRCKNPDCGKACRVKDESAGKSVKCPTCGQRITIPARQPDPSLDEPVADPAPREARSSPRAKNPERPRARAVWPWLMGLAAMLLVGAGGGYFLSNWQAKKSEERTAQTDSKTQELAAANADLTKRLAAAEERLRSAATDLKLKPKLEPAKPSPQPEPKLLPEPAKPNLPPEPKPLPTDVRAAWEKAGAETGWMGKFEYSNFREGDRPAEGGELPGIRWQRNWQDGVLAKLPAPEQAFGLASIYITDARLKYLARFKQLQWLDFFGSGVTDAGLKELAGLKQLQTLKLGALITDAGLKELAGIHQLKSLDLSLANVTDAGLKELTGLQQLQKLYLGREWVTDASLKELAGLKRLQALSLRGTRVTDAGLKELAGLKQLQTLDLRDTQVTDAGLKELAGLKQLQTLDLRRTQVTDAGLKELAGLKQLQTLNLYSNQVTDAGLRELAGLRQLQTLSLFGTRVTDAGLKELSGLQQLKRLYLGDTQVTEAGMAGLKQLQYHPLTEIKLTDTGKTKPGPTPVQPPAKDGWKKDPAAFARLYFGDNLEKRTTKEAGPVKGAKDIEKKVLGVAVEWDGEVLIDVVNKTGKKILMVPFSKAGWIWVSQRSIQAQLDSLALGSRVRVTMKLNAPIIPLIAGDGVPLIILGGDDARVTPR